MKKILTVVLLTGIASFLAACSTTSDPTAAFKNQSAEQIYQGGERDIATHSYSSAVKHFEALDALYPFSDRAEQAQLDLTYGYYKDGDYLSASATAERFIRLYPRSPHVDYAYYLKGLANYEQNRTWVQRYFPIDVSDRDLSGAKEAFDDFYQLVQLFPTSAYAPDARQRMIFLRNLFAKHDLAIAKYYLHHQAYVASANRASYILQHYNGAPQTEEALGILVVSNRQLGLQQPADQAMQVLQLNFPNSNVFAQLNKKS